ncbi:unnamed protein product [Sphenostylis stenocarpa]|uniref:PPC domain-containing protein n=1 Tax=Sphenostylis stenocarpa TaxID=92480 RepID=A0AA86T795_9FABA|nr:unnamed protein product [Sphenostylis stenocarpa]
MNPFASNPPARPPSSTYRPVAQLVDSSMKVFVVSVPPNRDIMESILEIAHRDHVSIAILSASGTIRNVTLRNSTHSSIPTRGPFTLLSLSGSYIYNILHTLHPGATPPFPLSFAINLSTPHGQIFGGVISGSVIAGENVTLTVSTFNNRCL